MAYSSYKSNKGVTIENKQTDCSFPKETDENNEFNSLIDYAENTIITAGTPSAQNTTANQIPNQLAINITSDSQSNVRINDFTDKEHIPSPKKTKRKSRLKYFVLLLVMIVIAAVSSSVTSFILKQNLETSLKHVRKESIWSPWSNWGECSVTCYVGIRSRKRTCNGSGQDGVPGICSGNDVDISSCSNDDCNSIWSLWANWGECSVTCNVGMRSRNRTCNGISQGGSPGLCFGNDLDISTCNNDKCTPRVTEGIWSYWANWGECSVTCYVGIRSRKRTCNGSGQDGVPGFCSGNDVDISSCSNDDCNNGQADKPAGPSDVSFSSYLKTTLTHVTKETPIVFCGVSNNAGNAYNSSSGIFTCPTAETYLFSLTVLAYDNKTAVLNIRVDDNAQLSAISVPAFKDHDSTGTIVFVCKLNVGQQVWAETHIDNTEMERYLTQFVGVLIHR